RPEAHRPQGSHDPAARPRPELDDRGRDRHSCSDISVRYIETRDARDDTVLELAILGLLKEQELHGYELKKRLAETLGPFSSVSFGSLYPALGRLEAAGAVAAIDSSGTARGPAPKPIPMTGSIGGESAAYRARRAPVRNGRSRKVYGITPRGEQLFA